MSLSLEAWHDRYTHQARWTQDLRRYLFQRAGIEFARRILEVGCGTGAILSSINDYTQGWIAGLDLNPARLDLTRRHAPQGSFLAGDAHDLPFANASFDLCFCHFLLLWVSNPEMVIAEMARVTRPGRPVLALAEPDYGGRIDYPDYLIRIGDLQKAALRLQGAEPYTGRLLAKIFSNAGLVEIETGVLGGQWPASQSLDDLVSEWQVLESDLIQIPEALLKEASGIDLDRLKRLDFEARQRGERVLFVPTFYALGRTPG
jgi:SAM-dependent methyltransferase